MQMLNENELDKINGGFKDEVTNEAQGYVGQEVFLVQNCKNGHKNFIRVKLLNAEPIFGRKQDTIKIKYESAAKPGDHTASNVNHLIGDGEVELGKEWNLFLTY